MASPASRALLAALTTAATVIAHGHVNDIIVDGVQWPSYNPLVFPYMSNPPKVVGWTTDQTDDGFIAPSAFTSSDIICHKNASNAGGHAIVAAGDKVFIQWSTWPVSHRGPVIDYLASCGSDGCETVDKTTLKFFKIDETGLIDGSSAPGTWASDQLIANNNSWMVEIPPAIKPGYYVLRHEIIALHDAAYDDGAQAYPQCFNLEVTGGGNDSPDGVLGTSLYDASDPGVLINIYTPLSAYTIPGPALYTGAVHIEQASSVATATSSAVTGLVSSAAASATTSSDTQLTSSTAAAASSVTIGVSATSTAESSATVVSVVALATEVVSATESSVAAASTEDALLTTAAASTTTATPVEGGSCAAKRVHARHVRVH
ncbi:hypothetical protein DL546_009783 [Coniochaeta pulveracea]|uniref:lytic cellulose monooxygenase (C4-dehydrogenating) n=1 Tax=Coniochaeta pulveracea TaxID=177199 RepID=A0A420YN37_9PEZI|nr:hypothetical protein DL546_009783 [Coniochaeta pulveracea]